ncbi:hypothetical protein D3C76_725160 [compost metagenome]
MYFFSLFYRKYLIIIEVGPLSDHVPLGRGNQITSRIQFGGTGLDNHAIHFPARGKNHHLTCIVKRGSLLQGLVHAIGH